MKSISRFGRRDFLKFSAAMLGGGVLASAPGVWNQLRWGGDRERPNVIVLVLDAMSARNLSLYGYVRATTPNLERIAARSAVYHSHYSGGNFTPSGTASMLTGLYPWTHRALTIPGFVARSLTGNNVFGLLGDGYDRFAYSQNIVATLLLNQFAGALDELLDEGEFIYRQNLPMAEEAFPKDSDSAFLAFGNFLSTSQFNQNPASLSLGLFDDLWICKSLKASKAEKAQYPAGLPSTFRTSFKLEDVFAGLVDVLLGRVEADLPLFAYLHVFPPHEPYRPRVQFLEMFKDDGVTFRKKPPHPLSEYHFQERILTAQRLDYDAFIADVDSEVGLFVDRLEAAGILDSSYLIITSDHGELFERAEWGHGSPLMYEPVIKIPLLIHAPGQTERHDVRAVTSNVDLVPTLLALAGREVPASIEGRLLPGFGGTEDSERSVFSVFAKKNSVFAPLDKSVVAMVKGRYKVIYYRGYPKYNERFEIYDLEEDPEELRDLSNLDNPTANGLKEEMLEAAHAADLPFERNR